MFKETNSAIMIFFYFFFIFVLKSIVKVELSYVFTINMFTIAENCTKSTLSYTNRCVFLFLVIICIPPKIIDS